MTNQEINQLRTFTTQMGCTEVKTNPSLAGTDEEDADDHTGVPDEIAVKTVHVDCWEQDSLQEEQRVCNELTQVQNSNHKDCSGLQISRDKEGSYLDQMTGTTTPTEAFEDCQDLAQVKVNRQVDGSFLQNSREGSDVDQERSTAGTSAQLQGKATPTHFLGFSSVVGTVSPDQEELHGIHDGLEQVQVKNQGISFVPISSRTSRESYLVEM